MTYSNSVCLGNWFEDRVQKQQGSKGGRIIADYGYRIFDTDASRTWGIKEEIPTKRSRAQQLKHLADQKAAGGFLMAQHKTYHESVENRVGKAPEEGFGSILPAMAKEKEVNFKTNNQFAMGDQKRESQTQKKAKYATNAVFAGMGGKKVKVRDNQPKGLSGEVWNGSTTDPQKSTLAQRSWMYGQDPAIKFKLKGYPVLKPEDIEQTGLAMPSQDALQYDGNKNFKRVAKLTKCSDVAGQNAKFGRNIFMDENL
mmetsp:Transcript_22013/g.41392  ORF Transcript_22013/g.41392 Transcript_22013/m.41392 type:complete len:255 (+) Transcript_22013:131-895(+)|eukprot:CAMPEP_0182520058 /NCGR_PEP_ID=MMETSP1321-20130603/45418_1 /TAXON_ID=91990 /ORGANISM="Bolidomonas sp., Strain RCC1657" /LENGTH=254 /DNA_ID=CAMNT_0024728061 /DNA_START=1340 /DNA_END=2104 /DNA_ORIENTATION=+